MNGCLDSVMFLTLYRENWFSEHPLGRFRAQAAESELTCDGIRGYISDEGTCACAQICIYIYISIYIYTSVYI